MKGDPSMPDLNALLQAAREYRALNPMTDEERSARARSFAYGNCKIENDAITREMVDVEAQKLGI
jgi:hypothetical protein